MDRMSLTQNDWSLVMIHYLFTVKDVRSKARAISTILTKKFQGHQKQDGAMQMPEQCSLR